MEKVELRPPVTGISHRREVGDVPLPVGVDVDGLAPRLDYVFEGHDACIDARATRSRKARVSEGLFSPRFIHRAREER